MLNLSAIQTASMEIAEAITVVLGIEIEIVDKNLKIIAGTGRYKEKIGTYEEDGILTEEEFYGNLLLSGEEVVVKDVKNYPRYHPKENELAEICCPIKLDDRVIGLIALVAFNSGQQNKILSNYRNLLLFLRKMASLIASKLAEMQKSSELRAIIESIHDGIIALDSNGIIVSCNKQSEQLLGKSKSQLLGNSINKFWSNFPLSEVVQHGNSVTDLEEIYVDEKGKDRHFLSTAMPIFTETDNSTILSGAVISFQNISDIRSRIFQMIQVEDPTELSEIVGQSTSITKIKQHILQFSNSLSTILITGESGTGKGLVARAIHYVGNRKSNPFVSINCGAIPDTLIESELFGYQPGAFTGARKSGKAGKFELANNGTILLDEIADFPLHLQAKLLHVIQTHQIERLGGTKTIPINVRIIAATNKNLEDMIRNKEFREDLYFRLNVIPFHLPPLRERQSDVLLLLNHTLNKLNKMIRKNIVGFSPESIDILLNYVWPGNVRELENVMEYAVSIEQGMNIQVESLPPRLTSKEHLFPSAELSSTGQPNTGKQSLKQLTDLYQTKIIEACLKQTGHAVEGKRKAANMLEISESTLYRKVRDLNIRSAAHQQ
jgi:PAS domain S-box-containing protein